MGSSEKIKYSPIISIYTEAPSQAQADTLALNYWYKAVAGI
jgi:hypothetical protein